MRYIPLKSHQLVVQKALEDENINQRSKDEIVLHLSSVTHDVDWIFEMRPYDICHHMPINGSQRTICYYRDPTLGIEFNVHYVLEDQGYFILQWQEEDGYYETEDTDETGAGIISDLAAHFGMVLEGEVERS